MRTVLQTPDACFENLPDYPFAPRHVDLAGVRMHHVDEGPADAPPVLMLHGEPTWSFLYRTMIPVIRAGGMRAVAPDLIGFGKSDKLPRLEDHSYQAHVDWVWRFIERLDLRQITLVCQDWGALIGLRIAAEHPERFAAILVANGTLPIATGKVPAAFRLWRGFARFTPVLPVGRIVAAGTRTALPAEVVAAYDAPFPAAAFKMGPRALPRLVPTSEKDPATLPNRAAWDALSRWEKPFLCIFGAGDPILGKADRALIDHVPGARGQPHRRVAGGHFIQEDQGPLLAQAALELARRGA